LENGEGADNGGEEEKFNGADDGAFELLNVGKAAVELGF